MNRPHPISSLLASQWELVGPITFLGLQTDIGVALIGVFTQRTSMRGGGWLRIRVLSEDKADIESYRTKKEALGKYVPVPFEYGGPNCWGI